MDGFKVTGHAYVPAGDATLKQGVKGNRTPHGAVAGGYGTFVMRGTPPQILLQFDLGKGTDIYYAVKNQADRKVTEKFAHQICSAVDGKQFDSEQELMEAIAKRIEDLG